MRTCSRQEVKAFAAWLMRQAKPAARHRGYLVRWPCAIR